MTFVFSLAALSA